MTHNYFKAGRRKTCFGLELAWRKHYEASVLSRQYPRMPTETLKCSVSIVQRNVNGALGYGPHTVLRPRWQWLTRRAAQNMY